MAALYEPGKMDLATDRENCEKLKAITKVLSDIFDLAYEMGHTKADYDVTSNALVRLGIYAVAEILRFDVPVRVD
jgi:hypothetical protein